MKQRGQAYYIGDTVELRKGATDHFAFKVDDFKVETVDEVRMYTIKFSIDDDYAYQREQFFGDFETESGRMIKEFIVLNDETVQIKLPASDTLRTIILKSPHYEESTRRLSIVE